MIVHLGTADGKIETKLASQANFLVHGLAMERSTRDAARGAIFTDGLYRLASVAEWVDRRRLSYASNLATAVIADLDNLPSRMPHFLAAGHCWQHGDLRRSRWLRVRRTRSGWRLKWKYLLAPTERYVCVNGQLESSWPVYGVCLSDGKTPLVSMAAGRSRRSSRTAAGACLPGGK